MGSEPLKLALLLSSDDLQLLQSVGLMSDTADKLPVIFRPSRAVIKYVLDHVG